MVGLAAPEAGVAQTEKVVHEEDTHGESVHVPYITYEEYQSTSLISQTTTGKSLEGNTKAQQVPFEALLSVSSLKDVIGLVGEPENIDRNVFPDGDRFIATLDYDGMSLKYAKRKDKRIRLTTMEVRSPEWSLVVGGKELRPGMSRTQLSPVVRQAIDRGTFLGEEGVDAVGVIRVAKPDKGEGSKVEFMEGEGTEVSVHLNKNTGTAKVIRFHRIV